jgi:secreted trypsin-like serine protease
MLGLVCLLVAAMASLAPAGAQASAGATASIVNGTAANAEEWPWAAFILAVDNHGEGFSCSGTVVAPNVVLTAGHCVEDIVTGQRTPPAQYTVVTGSRDVRDKTLRQISKVTRTAVNPDFNRFKVHGDAGLLFLATPTTAPPVTLAGPADAALLGPGTPAWIAGWGLSGKPPKLKLSPILRRGATFVQPRIFCRNHVRVFYPFFNFSSQLCTITPPGFSVGTCHGDSGGPALAFREDGTPVQIGVTSLGAADCDTHVPDIFTRVDRIYPWVTAQIAAAAAVPPPPPPAG